MSKILCFSVETPAEHLFFTKAFGDYIQLFETEVQDTFEIENPQEVEVITSFTGSEFTSEVIDRFPNLKLIATRSTGYDHIDLAYAQSKNITVCNVPVYGATTVAEHAFALLLELSRKVYQSYMEVQEHMDFSMRGAPRLQGFDLAGKTIGVIGAGNIGQNAIKIAHGFGMNIWAYDVHPSDELTKLYGVQWGISVEQVVKESDIITIHVPYNEHTHHLFNTKMLHYIHDKGMIVINTSRGEVVETDAILSGLDSGKLIGVGLDVLEMEHTLTPEDIIADDVMTKQFKAMQDKNRRLVEDPRVIVTPHNAFNTQEAIMRIWQTTQANITAYGAGTPQNVVTPQ